MFKSFFNKKKTAATVSLPKQTAEAVSHTSRMPGEGILNSGKRVKLPEAFLKKLIPLGNLPAQELQSLDVKLIKLKPGEIVFNRGDKAEALFYLVKGVIFVETAGGNTREIAAETMEALYPLSTGEVQQLKVIAKSAAAVICFPLACLRFCTARNYSTETGLLNIPEQLADNNFIRLFNEQFREGQFKVPNLPDVALRLRAAMQQDIGIAEAVIIVNMDPVIAAKLIQTANSPVYRTLTPASSCHEAINRMGLAATRIIVISFSMKNLFICKNKVLRKRLDEIWRQSIQIASISRTLAVLTRAADPEEALLAGLVHNIGAIPMLRFADSLSADECTAGEIEDGLTFMSGQVGSEVLRKWEFPERLADIPVHCEDWFYDSGGSLALVDIVILARFHSLLGRKQVRQLPLLSTLSAFQKLDDNTLTPDLSLQVLHDAEQQILDAMNLFLV